MRESEQRRNGEVDGKIRGKNLGQEVEARKRKMEPGMRELRRRTQPGRIVGTGPEQGRHSLLDAKKWGSG